MGARKFSMVHAALWNSKRFTGLQCTDAQLLFLYLLTCSHNNSAGAYLLKPGYALVDIGWILGRYQKALDLLIESDLISYDAVHDNLYIRQWFTHNPPQNPKHLQGTYKLIDQLGSLSIKQLVLGDLKNCLAEVPWNSSVQVSPSLLKNIGRGS